MTALHVNLFPPGDSLHDKAYEFYADDSRFCLALSGRRGAKTYTGAKRFWRKVWYGDWPAWHAKRAAGLIPPYSPGAARRGAAMWWDRRPRLHYWVVADEYSLLDEPKRYLAEFLPQELLEHPDNARGRWWLRGDILVEFKTGHDPKTLVSPGLAGAWVEEADRMRADAWKGYLRPTLTDKGGWAQFTTTPLGQTWTYDDLELHARNGVPGYGFHTWRTVDNDKIPGIQAEVEQAKLTLPPQYFRREYEASRDAFAGQIYDLFDEHTMIEDALPRNVVLFGRAGGQDWGFTNPGAAVVAGASNSNPNLAHLWIVDEVYERGRLVEDVWVPAILRLNDEWRFNDWSCDPEAPDDIQRYRDAGIHAVGHRNYTASRFDEHERDVKAGIRMIAALMFQKRFHILRRCKNTIAEMKSYRWDTERGKSLADGGGLIERPAKGQMNHAMDAMRYAATRVMRGANFEAMGIAA